MLEETKDAQGEVANANKKIKELHEKGAHKEALALATRTVEFARRRLGEMHPLAVVSLGNLAVELKWLGRLDDAKQVYEKLLNWYKATGTEQSEFHARTLNNLAELCLDSGDNATAESLHTQALTILESVLPPDDPGLADSLSNLAQIYARTGKHFKAEKLLRRAVEIDERTVGKDHFLYGMRLGNLAAVLHSLGQHAEGMRLLRQALRIIYDSMGRQHPQFADTLCKVAAIYRTVGDLPEAERLYKEALEIQFARLGRTQHVAGTLDLLASLYTELRREKEAESARAQAQEIRREIGQSQPVSNLLQEAHRHASMGDLDSAESLFRQVVQIEESLGENYPPLASTLNNLAQVLKSKGLVREAEELYRRALAIQLAASGSDHPSRATILHNLGMLCAATDRAAEALQLMKEAEAVSEREIGQIFSLTSERQRLDYLEEVADRTSCVLSLVSEHFLREPDAVRAAFELVLRRKGIAAEALAVQRTAILRGRYPAVEPKLREISDLKGRISQTSWSGSVTQDWAAQRQLSAELRARLEQLEMEVAQEVSETDLAKILRAIDTDAVASALPEGTVLVEFVRLHRIDFRFQPTQTQSARGPAHYLAFVLPPRASEKLRMFDLGETWPIDQRIAKYRRFLSEIHDGNAGTPGTVPPSWPTGDPDREVGDELRRMLLDPLGEAISGFSRLFLAPVGDLTRLPFQVLPLGGDRYLTNAFNIGYLSAGRDVLRLRTSAEGNPSDPIVIADPDFDLTTAGPLLNRERSATSARSPLRLLKKMIAKVSGQQPSTPARASSGKPELQSTSPETVAVPSSSRYSRDLHKRGFKFEPLPGTRVEGERVGRLLAVQPWLGAAALKGRLRSCRSPRILHVATHGFFLADQTRSAGVKRPDPHATHQVTGDSVGSFQGPGMESPLARSGLALAGANTTLAGGPLPLDAENGLLTAEDMSGLDLSSTELITLSDCDTGLGDLHVSEGVFGLRRSCSVAGAQTLVMSLWKVPDVSTAILMVKFYQNLRDGFGRCDALLAAQDYVREVTIGELRSDWLTVETIDQFAAGSEEAKFELEREYVHQPNELRPFAQPFFWGAFICEGQPGQLAWSGMVQVERFRVPAFVWPLPQDSEIRPDSNAVHVTPNRPAYGPSELIHAFDLPDRVSSDIGLIVSPDSRRVAYGVQDRHGMHIELDGRQSRGYEQVFGLQLTDEGLAYCASRGRRMFVVFNEQEHDGWDDIGKSSPTISPDSHRVGYAARRGNGWYAVIDGIIVGGPYEGLCPGGILFSPDSRRYAYAVKRGPFWLAVVDGAEGPSFPAIVERSLTFSPNSTKVAYVACVKGRRIGPALVGEAATVVNNAVAQTWPVDEVTRNSGLSAELYFSLDSRRLAYSGLENGRSFVVVDDQVYGDYDGFISGWRNRPDGKVPIHHSENQGMIAFSPDSRRLAYAARHGSEAVLELIDADKQRFTHDSILNQPPLFSPDSMRLAYGIEQHLEQGVVVDGRVRWAYGGLPPVPWSFGPDSKLLAYVAWNGSGRTQFLALNGRELHLRGSILVNSSIVWDDRDHLHCLVSDGRRIWVQEVAVSGNGQPTAL